MISYRQADLLNRFKQRPLAAGERVKAQQWIIDRLLNEQNVDFTGVEGVVTKAEGSGRVGVRWDGDGSDDIIEVERVERVA